MVLVVPGAKPPGNGPRAEAPPSPRRRPGQPGVKSGWLHGCGHQGSPGPLQTAGPGQGDRAAARGTADHGPFRDSLTRLSHKFPATALGSSPLPPSLKPTRTPTGQAPPSWDPVRRTSPQPLHTVNRTGTRGKKRPVAWGSQGAAATAVDMPITVTGQRHHCHRATSLSQGHREVPTRSAGHVPGPRQAPLSSQNGPKRETPSPCLHGGN